MAAAADFSPEKNEDEDVLLPPDLREIAEKELNETPERRRAGLQQLRQLLNDHADLQSRTDSLFLLRFLRVRKFNVPEAFRLIQNYYRIRLENTELFKDLHPSAQKHLFDLQCQSFLQDTDAQGRKVFVLRIGKWKPGVCMLDDMFRPNILTWEHIIEDPRAQVLGIVALIDLKGGSMKHVRCMTPAHAFKVVQVVQDCFPIRLRGFHVVRQPLFFKPLFQLLKPFLKKKFVDRMHMHGNDIASLHQHLSSDILYEDLGGHKGPFDNSWLCQEMYENDERFKEHSAYGYRKLEPGEVEDSFNQSRIKFITNLWKKYSSMPCLPDDIPSGATVDVQKYVRKTEVCQ